MMAVMLTAITKRKVPDKSGIKGQWYVQVMVNVWWW
jgi:hypothetical protein